MAGNTPTAEMIRWIWLPSCQIAASPRLVTLRIRIGNLPVHRAVGDSRFVIGDSRRIQDTETLNLLAISSLYAIRAQNWTVEYHRVI